MKSIDALIDGLKQAKDELEKAIKPGPTLDYSKINPPVDRAAQEAAAPTINYGKNPMSAPKWTGAAGKTAAVRAKIDAEANESGLDTIMRRNKTAKSDGNVGDETMKDDSMNGGFAMSEKEPHKDDPKHEHKEVEIGKKVKEEAQDLIDMHKDESCIKGHVNGQWFIGEPIKKDNSVKPFGANIYNEKANVGRKMNRTGEVVEGVGRNNATHNYTTSGSSVQGAHEASQNKKYKAEAKTKVRTMKDMSPDELKSIQQKAGKK